MIRASVLMLFLLLLPSPALGQRADPWCYTGFHPGEVQGAVVLPEGDLFCPLLADPKAEHSFLSYLRGDFAQLTTEGDGELNVGSIGIGDALPLVRLGVGTPGNGFQVGVVAGIFAQFNLDAPSIDLINADYLVGVPATFRYGTFSTRLRIYHQSSHLGDEFILNTQPERENLTFEALELLLSQELGPVRAYGGGEVYFNREPETLRSGLAHGGLELRLGSLRGARLVAAVDVKTSEEQEWEPGWSARAGIEVAHWRDASHPPRFWSVLFEYYDGPTPYGQFFREQVRYLGLGLHLTL